MVRVPTRRAITFSSPTKAPPQMNRMFDGVYRSELLVRMLAAALGRHIGDGAFQNLQQRLLDAFAGDVARDGRVLVLTADLVDLVYIDDALLAALDIPVGSSAAAGG